MNVSKNITKLPKSVVSVEITVQWPDIEPKWDETLQKLASEMEFPGFRKGQAPIPMVEQQLGNKLSDEAFKVIMPQALIEALQGTDIVPIDYPQYQIVSFVKGEQLVFKALITQRPQIQVGEYKTMKVQRPTLKIVTDEDVTKMIDELFKRWKARQSAQQQKTPSLGQSQQTAQPTNAGSLNFAAQPTQVVQTTIVSDTPDDNFAKTVGAENLVDLKQKIRQDLEQEAKYNNELDYEGTILQEVEKLTQVEIPEILVQDELNRMLVSLQRRVTEMGFLFDDYLKSQKKTLDGLKQEWRPQAEKNVRMELGLSEIARRENISITDEELQTEIDKIQDNRVKQQFEAEEPKMHLRHALRQTKTLTLLKGLAGA